MVLSKPSKLIVRMIGIAALIIILIGVVYYRSFAALPFALGVIVTSVLNIIKMRMLERTVQKVTDMDTDDQDTGKNIVRIQYLLRYFITGVVLAVTGVIQNYTTPPPEYSNRTIYINVWATLFPQGPESLLNAPFISVWGALAGIFTLQIAVFIVRSMKLEKDGDNFIKYDDEDDTETGSEKDSENSVENDDENDVNY